MQYSVRQEPSFRRWNYKKADWSFYKDLTDDLRRKIHVEGRDINRATRDFNTAILKAAHKCIPRGSRRDYKLYWSNDLDVLQDDLSEVRREVETNPSQENNISLQQAKAKFLQAKIHARRKSWKEKTASLNLEKDDRTLWKLTKQLNDEGGSNKSPTALVENATLLTGKQAANRYADNYKDVSNIPISRERQREVMRDERERRSSRSEEVVMEERLTLQIVLKQLKAKKSPGPDDITNEMLTNLGCFAMHTLLDIYNLSWREGRLPQIWQEAIMIIPIHKSGTNSKEASSYHPISLTSVVGKTMESIVNQRMKRYLETNQLLAHQQVGFRMFRSTED